MFKKPAREVSRVFVHCSASDEPAHDDPKVIRDWHLARGFHAVGYHYIITKDGHRHRGRSLEKQPAAQKGHNTETIAICVTGLTRFSVRQIQSLLSLCIEIDDAYAGGVTFHGHREVNAHKTCPVFEYATILRLDDDGRME